MKKISLLFIIGLLLIFLCNTGICNGTTDDQTGVQTKISEENTLKITSSPELSKLTTSWAAEYGRLNPGLKIVVNNNENQPSPVSDLRFISEINDEVTWKLVIGHDVIVPVVNAKNPMLNEIYRQGISAEKFALLFTNPERQKWGTIIDGGKNAAINYFIINNESVKTNIANFSKTNSEAINGVMVASTTELILAVQNDIYAIGFCKLTDVRDATTNELIEGINLLPIDKNKNGRIDNFENIYDHLRDFARGVWIGKYPRELSGSIYAVSSTKPTDENTLTFLTWILADGQQFLNQNGYSDLANIEIQSNMETLVSAKKADVQPINPSASQGWLLKLLAVILILSIAILSIRYFRNKKMIEIENDINFTPAFDENSVLAPQGLYFDKSHTWAFMEKDGMVKVGIDDFLQHITGKLTRVKMKEPGETIRKGEKVLTIIRNGKQLNICAPISGIIKEQNQQLTINSSMINSAPFSEGWVYLIEPKNWVRETQFLLMGNKYREWLKDEFTRLKDFFAASVKSNTVVYAHIILQDGGELTDNVLADLEPEVWEDFQTKFIDTSK